MTTDAPWESTRWRDAHYPGSYDGLQPTQLPASMGANSTSQGGILHSFSPVWHEKAHQTNFENQARGLAPLTDPYTDASTYHSRLQERHSPPTGGFYGPQKLTCVPAMNTAWQNLPFDDVRSNERHGTEAPLTLHIPQAQDLPRISSEYNIQTPQSQPQSGKQLSRSQTTTSLPSFATFQEHTNRTDDPEEAEIASMAARLGCHLCSKLKPMVREVATAVADVDENVQIHCNKSVTRTHDCPQDSPVRAVQWILDRLRVAKSDLQAVKRNVGSIRPFTQSSTLSRNLSPSNTMKRSAERWDQDDMPTLKRSRFGGSPDEGQGYFAPSRDDRRASLDFSSKDQLPRSGFSPPPTDSVPNSAYPRTGSPNPLGRQLLTLPSPSSLAYPPSAPPSVAAHNAQSVDSPSTSYQPAVSIHTASTSSATSAHIADLQHQVTLKSLALQTLQSEYASLLQKLQRERVKSQTIEKKTSVADQEVNELTSKNEDLTEQIKSLETQLDESEKKRETERSDYAREKEQWGRMLELGGRLHAKNAEEKQKLKDEKASLSERVAAYEEPGSTRATHQQTAADSRVASPRRPEDADVRISHPVISESHSTAVVGSVGDATSDNAILKRQVGQLNARIDILRFTLEETRRHNRELDDRAQQVVKRSGEIHDVIDRALNEERSAEQAPSGQPNRDPKVASGRSTPARQKPTWSPNEPQTAYASYDRHSKSPIPREMHRVSQSSASSTSSTTMASMTRVVSPGHAELGFHAAPSTSSPEKLIQALGPVPDLPQSRFQCAPNFISEAKDSARSGGNEKRNNPQQQSSAQANPWITTFSRNEAPVSSLARPPSHHIPSPYASIGRITTHAETSPHSYHSSPGPIMDEPTSSSSASTSEGSPAGSGIAPGLSRYGDDASVASQFREYNKSNQFRSIDSSSSMPPPPRPSPQTGGYDSTTFISQHPRF